MSQWPSSLLLYVAFTTAFRARARSAYKTILPPQKVSRGSFENEIHDCIETDNLWIQSGFDPVFYYATFPGSLPETRRKFRQSHKNKIHQADRIDYLRLLSVFRLSSSMMCKKEGDVVEIGARLDQHHQRFWYKLETLVVGSASKAVLSAENVCGYYTNRRCRRWSLQSLSLSRPWTLPPGPMSPHGTIRGIKRHENSGYTCPLPLNLMSNRILTKAGGDLLLSPSIVPEILGSFDSVDSCTEFVPTYRCIGVLPKVLDLIDTFKDYVPMYQVNGTLLRQVPDRIANAHNDWVLIYQFIGTSTQVLDDFINDTSNDFLLIHQFTETLL